MLRATSTSVVVLALFLCLPQEVAHAFSTARSGPRHTHDDTHAFSSKRQFLPSNRNHNNRPWLRFQAASSSSNNNSQVTDNHDDESNVSDSTRRQAWRTALTTLSLGLVAMTTTPTEAAHAALLQFPCSKLKNRYHFMRAGLSELQAEDLYASNALFLTNRENALVDSNEARKPIIEACRIMREAGQSPTVAYHSLAANGMDTADLVARTLLLARDRLLPEFTYLDPRGIGLWDGSSYSKTRMAVAAMDNQQAGPLGLGGRPPANTDGTPNETLADQFIRLRQFFSLQESRTSGENILVIFPDGTGPALASAMIAGLPLNTCHALEFVPGEIRLDITQQSVLDLYAIKKDDPAYLTMLEQGQEYWQALKQESLVDFVSLKERRAEEKRVQDDLAFATEQQRKQRLAERERQDALAKLRREQEEARQEQMRLRQEQHRQQAAKKAAKIQGVDGTNANDKEAALAGEMAMEDETQNSFADVVSLTLGLGASIGGFALLNSVNVATHPVARAAQTATADKKKEATPPTTMQVSSPSSLSPSSASSLYAQPVPTVKQNDASDDNAAPSSSVSSSVKQELETLQEAQARFTAGLIETKDTTFTKSAKHIGDGDPVQQELDTLEQGQNTLNDYMDFEDDWLRILAEIRDEDDDNDD